MIITSLLELTAVTATLIRLVSKLLLRARPRCLIDSPEHAGETRRLLELMKQWQAKSDDKLKVPEQSKPYTPVDLTGRKRTPDEWQPEWIVKKYF